MMNDPAAAAGAAAPNTSTQREQWKEFVTQTDWSGPVMQESWYYTASQQQDRNNASRHPCRRITLYVHLSCVLSAVAMSITAVRDRWPILYPYSLTLHHEIKESHAECWRALCHAVEHVELECYVTEEFQVVVDPSTIPENPIIPLPTECHDAIRLSFGEHFEQEWLLASKLERNNIQETTETTIPPLQPRQIDLLHFQDSMTNEKSDNGNFPIVKVFMDQCLVEESLLQVLVLGQIFRGPVSGGAATVVVDLFDTAVSLQQPGDRERIALRSYACPRHMSRSMREDILPKLQQLYDLLMSWRHIGALLIMYWISLMYHSAMCATRIFFLILPSFFLWLIMPPKRHPQQQHEIKRGERITTASTTTSTTSKSTFLQTLSTLLLLTTLVDQGSGGLDEMLRTGILVASALSFGNSKAALEWFFLFFLSYMDLDGLSEGWESQRVMMVDYLLRLLVPTVVLDWAKRIIVPWIDVAVSLLVPGFGLWKIVTVYVIYMAVPKRQRQ